MERTVNNGSQFIINSLPNRKPMSEFSAEVELVVERVTTRAKEF